MTHAVALLCEEIRTIYRQENHAHNSIEKHLELRLGPLPFIEKRNALRSIIEKFKEEGKKQYSSEETSDSILHFVSQLLGEPVETLDLEKNMLQQKLNSSLETIFTSLNELLQTINDTLGQGNEFDQTIRHVLRKQLDEKTHDAPLEDYLDQIKKTFLITYESFNSAHLQMMNKVLEELNPKKSIDECVPSLKFGALRKAEAFDHYSQRYNTIHAWHESGRGLEEYLRTFEKQCSTPLPLHKEIQS